LSGLLLKAIACVDIFDGGYSRPPNSGFIYSLGLAGKKERVTNSAPVLLANMRPKREQNYGQHPGGIFHTKKI
jgi:hypothetical protein